VKPQNLLLGPHGTLKVSDFGIARLLDGTQLTGIGTVLGTAAYLAPEQLEGRPVTPSADVWALGVVLYELLTGGPPFPASTPAELMLRRTPTDPRPPGSLVPGVPQELDALVSCCLRTEPASRPTAREVELALRGELEAPTVVLPASPEARTSVLRRSQGRRRRALGVGAAAAAVALALGLGLRLGGGGPAKKPQAPQQVVAPIPPSPTAAAEALNLARWLRARAG
jgi:serine/threonine protein kinase